MLRNGKQYCVKWASFLTFDLVWTALRPTEALHHLVYVLVLLVAVEDLF
jgi:hypothetical protein